MPSSRRPIRSEVACCHRARHVIHHRSTPPPSACSIVLPGAPTVGEHLAHVPGGSPGWPLYARVTAGCVQSTTRSTARSIKRPFARAQFPNVVPRCARQHALPARSTQTRPPRRPTIPRSTERTPQSPRPNPRRMHHPNAERRVRRRTTQRHHKGSPRAYNLPVHKGKGAHTRRQTANVRS